MDEDNEMKKNCRDCKHFKDMRSDEEFKEYIENVADWLVCDLKHDFVARKYLGEDKCNDFEEVGNG